MNWNRVVIASTAFALLGVVTLALSRTPAAKAQIRAPSAGAVHKAFTATLVENRYDASGALKSVEVSLVAAKSDGSSVWVRQSLNGRPMALRRVRDLSAGKSVTIDPVTESTTTYLMSSDELTALRAVPACGRPAPGQLDAILGQGVVHQLQQLPDGSQLQESVAPDLDCFPMRLVSGSAPPYNDRVAVALTLGDPDPSLFQVPGNYTERRPSEVLQMAAALKGKDCKECRGRTGAALDAVYYNHAKLASSK